MLSDDEPTTWRRLRAATGRTEIAARADETRARSVMLDAVGVGLAEVRSNGAFVRANARFYAMLGHARDALPTLTLESILLPTDPPLRVDDLTVSCLENTRPPVCRRLRRGDGEVIWVELTASLADPSHVNGNYLLTLVDITRFKAAEVRLAESELRQAELEFSREGNLLAWELRHRLRNVFPTILLIAKMTVQQYPAAAEYCQALERRLRALSAAEDLMSRTQSTSVILDLLVRTELLPFEGNAAICIEGPVVTLRGPMAECFAILLHELTTNAAKYGALSVRSGKLTVKWNITRRGNNERVVTFEWLERGGPRVLRSHRSGFGASIIRQSGELLGGVAHANYAPEGLSYRLEFPEYRSTEAGNDASDTEDASTRSQP